jgi:K+-transporting ATPase KdpF subunit
MSAIEMFGLLISLALAVYLLVALLKPENFE